LQSTVAHWSLFCNSNIVAVKFSIACWASW